VGKRLARDALRQQRRHRRRAAGRRDRRKYEAYNLVDQWTSYGWNVLTVANGNDYGQVVAALKTMENWDPNDRRP
jgi:transketolase N-terminal domain/subunit